MSGLSKIILNSTPESLEDMISPFIDSQFPDFIKSEHRNLIIAALKAEGVPSLISKYTNVHRLPIFTNRIAFGSNGYPWTISRQEVFETYGTGACPVAEEFYDKSFIGLHMCSKQFSDRDIDYVVNAFIKVWDGLGLS